MNVMLKMKILLLILLKSTLLFSQRVALNASNYDNYIVIDNYYGETNPLLLKYKIKKMKCFLESDSNHLIKQEYYKDGKLFKPETIDLKTGKPKRVISYSNSKENALEAEFIHYPSSDNNNVLPSKDYTYLWTYSPDGKIQNLRYPRDSLGIVYMKIKYQWLSNGNILYHSYDKDGK
jgi:hypothetical protein